MREVQEVVLLRAVHTGYESKLHSVGGAVKEGHARLRLRSLGCQLAMLPQLI